MIQSIMETHANVFWTLEIISCWFQLLTTGCVPRHTDVVKAVKVANFRKTVGNFAIGKSSHVAARAKFHKSQQKK